jgi:3-oxoadipate enol-lactonase/4-carboxymuconolactone decarboxylase
MIEAPAHYVQTVLSFLAKAEVVTERERYDAGLARRKEALGSDYVASRLAAATPFATEFQNLITRYAWGEVWTREVLDDRVRRLLVLGITSALGRLEELDLHLRAGLERELTAADVKEALLLVAIYAGVPAANTAFARAGKVLAERGTP